MNKAAKAGRVKRDESRDSGTPTREVILDTAAHLFAVRGVDGVALRDLAREMGLTAPSLYNHFPSKQALYDAVLERGLRPVVQIIAEAWHPGALQTRRMRTTVDRLTAHLATNPNLSRLLQRALLDESANVQKVITRWLTPLYREGLVVIRATAGNAGWKAEEVPHLAMGLFGLVFAYFANASAIATLAGRSGDPLSGRALAVQRRFQQKAIYRLLGPGGADTTSKRSKRG